MMPGSQVASPLSLVALSDPAMGVRELDASKPTLVGRQSQCEVQLADQTVSRVHAVIEWKLGTWYITDKSSRLGTLLNGVRLEAEQPVALRDNDVLSVARWSFRAHAGKASSAGAAMTLIGSSRLSDQEQGRVETFRSDAILGQAEKRLHLVMDLAASLHAASQEQELAQAVVTAAANGSPFDRVAMIKSIPGTDVVVTLAARIGRRNAPQGFAFSRSLVRAASGGEIAKLTGGDSELRHAVSIVSQGILNAVCAPIMVGDSAAAYLYMDQSGEFGAPPPPATPEVDAYIAAVARIASLSLAELQRRQLQARHTQLEADLAAARHAQEQLMPAPSGDVGGLRYAALNQAGRLVAGDLVDVFELGEGRIAACLGDVSGKGVGAAMLMASVQTQLRGALTSERDPAKAIAKVNREVIQRRLTEGFISLWAGVFDRNNRTLTYVDCGHSYWIHRAASAGSGSEASGGSIEQRWTAGDGGSCNGVTAGPVPQCLLLGVELDEEYRANVLQLEAGDRITVYSDGVAEQLSPAGLQFKPDGVISTLRTTTTVNEDVHRLMDALRAHAGGDKFSDDVTILSMTLA